ncbi:MAG: hypothetical protein ACD_16C00079G0002 [uncultured bacterium]|nr:MAG: hypothetical protein ACD_16C00079G0002 [uncultured bacterium]OFW67956.1 MAG: hypothetical protein A2X70_07460 [Alphaproteobacteria bacterium GWC2_42_16]OFW74659.1 MAG: hypothetical protein A2Z80_00620 [Alphaproteobacteria bacterium GWA2_41_27]OFW84963.1 MAG: hypothetical protein A3E50_03000 [Alphaproteobacteria bacterium RIFCSPHIGHO2_12_FULL_42_100]OFW85570.1 MAG: hypothetical protein A2W06_03140 [Alphaproteobacteria bacterium RBG_16_42_14]OFW92109.1 MAG: hypothetical protein A2W46_062
MKKILYFVVNDHYFCSHRLHLAKAAQAKGADIVVVTTVFKHGESIQKAGFKLIPLQSFHKSKVNLLKEAAVFKQLFSIFLKEQPDILHNIGMKPILYGGLVAKFTKVSKVVNLFPGLGFLFTHHTQKTRISRKVVEFLFKKVLFKNEKSIVIVQNADDQQYFQKTNLIDPKRLYLIRGSGVDTKAFPYSPEPKSPKEIRIAFVSRMLKDKGILELIEAIRLLKAKGVKARFLFYGDIDPQNPSSVQSSDLETWQKEGLIAYQGFCEDIHQVYRQAHLAVLPSYREGLPKSLLEAASCGRAIIATDVPGCREIVRPDINGLLVPSQNVPQLAGALEKLIENEPLRQSMGKAGRLLVEEHFSIKNVVSETLKCYGL